MTDLARLLILCGGLLVLAGVVMLGAGRIPWLGRLPGDLTIRWSGGVLYLPLATSIVVSVVLSLLLSLLRR